MFNGGNMNKRMVFDSKYSFVVVFSLAQIVFGFTQNSFLEIRNGLQAILTMPSSLITDYIGLGNMGAAFVNSGLVTLVCILLLYRLEQSLSGPLIAALFTISGFALFGKNLFNVWFILLGAYAYSRFKKEKFNKYLIPALFGTAMAPAITEIAFRSSSSLFIGIPLAMAIGILLGFLISPLASSLINVHQGYNLYNVGFTVGMLGLIFVSIMRSFGYVPTPQFIWSSGNNLVLSTYLFGLFLSMLITGFFINGKSFNNYKKLMSYSGKLITDFIQLEGFGITLINMGITGLISTGYILLIQGDLNGPTIGGILTISGFSAFGKHPKNILPIFLGVLIGSLLKVFYINDPAIQLAALFGTTLSPIAGKFGWQWGVVAGFIHSSVVLNVGYLHGGFNLYNNGFAAGLVAAVLLPIIALFKKDEGNPL
jgi:hypothetical protein